jgi:hypothetical protein
MAKNNTNDLALLGTLSNKTARNSTYLHLLRSLFDLRHLLIEVRVRMVQPLMSIKEWATAPSGLLPHVPPPVLKSPCHRNNLT